MIKSVYCRLQIKKCFKLFLPVFTITLAVYLVVALAVFGFFNSRKNSAEFSAVKIGVVGDTDGTYLGVGVEAVKKTDSSGIYAELVNMTESEAKKSLEKGEISGYVCIPRNFVNNVTSGADVSLKYVSSGSAAINKLIEQEVISSVSDLVKETQKNIYATIDMAKDYEKKDIHKKVQKLNLSYISQVLNRHRVFELCISGIKDELGYGRYYLCAIVIFFLCIWGISCSYIIFPGDLSFLRILKSRGIGEFRQIFSCAYGYLVITYLTFFVLAIAVGMLFSGSDANVSEFGGIDAISAVVFVIKLFPVTVMFVFMHIMLGELLKGIGGIMVQFVVAVIMGYVSGLFYPISFFSRSLQVVSSYLPWGAAFSYTRKLMSHTDVVFDFIIVVLYGMMFAAISVLLRKHRIAGDKTI